MNTWSGLFQRASAGELKTQGDAMFTGLVGYHPNLIVHRALADGRLHEVGVAVIVEHHDVDLGLLGEMLGHSCNSHYDRRE